MPTAVELERLKVLAERLEPLARAAPGELILAESWNTLVGVVGELARALLAQDRAAELPAHEHVDQVSLGWLEPSLRALIQRGPLADPVAETRLADIKRRVDRLGQRHEGLDEAVGELRGSLDGVATRDLVREAQLTLTQRTLESQAGTVDDVGALRETLGSVQSDVRAALDIGRRLTVDGQAFDAAALVERVGAVEALRDRLRLPDGELLDASALERRLTELTTTLVTETELDEALARRRVIVDPDVLAGVEERLRLTVAGDAEAAAQRATDRLQADLTTRLAGVDEQVQRAVSDAAGGLREELGQSQGLALQDAVERLREQTENLLSDRTSVLAGELRAELLATEERTRDFATTTAKELSLAAAQDVAGRLGTRIDDVDAITSKLSDQQTELSRELVASAARIEQVAVQESSARDAQIAALRREQSAEFSRLDTRVTEVEQRRTTDLASVGELTLRIDDLLAKQDDLVRLAAEEAVRSFDARVERVVTERVDAQLTDIDATIQQAVKSEVEVAQVAIARNVRTDLAAINDRVTSIDRRIGRGGPIG